MNFNKPIRFIRRYKGKDEYLDVIPNQLTGWKTLETLGNAPERVWFDETLVAKAEGKE